MPEETKKDSNSVFVVVIPTRGDMHCGQFPDTRKGFDYLQEWLEKRDRGLFEGEVLAFYGQKIDYSEPQLEYHFHMDSIGHVKHTNPKAKINIVSPQPINHGDEPTHQLPSPPDEEDLELGSSSVPDLPE